MNKGVSRGRADVAIIKVAGAVYDDGSGSGKKKKKNEKKRGSLHAARYINLSNSNMLLSLFLLLLFITPPCPLPASTRTDFRK
jgi:hypothetical protein